MPDWTHGKRGSEVELDATSTRFGYGRFVGADGHWHVSIQEPVKGCRRGGVQGLWGNRDKNSSIDATTGI